MDTGQITQGLRTDAFQQVNGNGISAAQMIGNGFSFADIVSVILANGQEMQDDGNMQMIENFSNSNSNIATNLFDSNNSLSFNGMKGLGELLNAINVQSADSSFDELNSEKLFNLLNSLEWQDPSYQKKFIEEINNLLKSKNYGWNIKNDDLVHIEDIPDKNNFDKKINEFDLNGKINITGSNDENTLHIKNAQSKSEISNNHSGDNYKWLNDTSKEVNYKNVLNIQNVVSSNVDSDIIDSGVVDEITNKSEKKNNYALKENLNISDDILINNNLDELMHIETKSTETNIDNVSDIMKFHNIKDSSFQTNDIKTQNTFNDDLNLSEIKNVNVDNIDDASYNAYNVMNLRDIHAVSDILGFDKDYKLSSDKNINFQNFNSQNTLSKKIIEIFSVASPEIVQTLRNASSEENINFGNNFIFDLISELSNDQNKSDIFDFSESVLKFDPLQLAGLLDFISTGTTIPDASDVSDSQLFKNIDKTTVVDNYSEKMIFDPKEMIRTGEMEIISYVSADSNPESDLKQNKNPIDNGEKTINFARTMKSVKENVNSFSAHEAEKNNDAVAVTVDDLNNSVEKIDISFDRAYAELEMNKAKYGSADEQLFKGISEHLKKGKSEFTVKLRPEGLGEILVKLVSNEGGKTILSMIASSEKTAQLLNRDLASLQTSLNQHNVEIENNSVKTVETVMSAQTSFDQYDERRQDEAAQQNQFRKLRSKLGNISVGNVSFDNETESINNISIDSALNITI